MAPIVFPDAVAAAVQYMNERFAARGETARVGTRVPSTRPGRFVRLERVGGTRLDLITDRARLDVHCWGESEEDAIDLAQLARALLFDMPGWHGSSVYDVVEVGGPNNLPDPTSGQPRYAFAVEIALRGKHLVT